MSLIRSARNQHLRQGLDGTRLDPSFSAEVEMLALDAVELVDDVGDGSDAAAVVGEVRENGGHQLVVLVEDLISDPWPRRRV